MRAAGEILGAGEEPSDDRSSYWVWWAHQDLNLEPTDYESAALTVELWALEK